MAQNGLFPVTYRRHQHQFWKRFTSFDFASKYSECPVVLEEVFKAAAAFPIVFKDTNGAIEPTALLSLSPDLASPYVSSEGNWLANYVPSKLRSFPFFAEPTGKGSVYRLLVDENSNLVTRASGDQTFFKGDGTISPELQEVQTYLRACSKALEETQSICLSIEKLGLFEQLDSYENVSLPPGSLGIAPEKLETLPKTDKAKLLDCGAIQLIYAHNVSLSHCRTLAQAQLSLISNSTPQKYTENSDVSAFLYAIANAQNDDFPETIEV